MNKLIKNIKENKVLHIIGNIIYTLAFIAVLLMLIVVILQRVTDNAITIGGFRIFTVATGSMEPKYEVGDILISKEINENEISIGDDIVYKGEVGSYKDKMITHQVVSIRNENGEIKITTKGIANSEEDPEISSGQVYGKIIYKVKTLSFIGKIIKNVYLFYFIIFVPIALIIFKQIENLLLNDEDDEDDDIDTVNKSEDGDIDSNNGKNS